MNARSFSAGGLLMLISLVPANAGTSGPADLQMNDQQCETLWKQAKGEQTGDLTTAQAQLFLRDQAKADKDGDGKVSAAEWTNACHEGSVNMSLTAPPDQPLPPNTASP